MEGIIKKQAVKMKKLYFINLLKKHRNPFF